MKILILILLFLTLRAHSQTPDSNIGMDPAATLIHGILGNYKKTAPPNQIKGSCLYMNSPCNGAEILLLKDGNAENTRRLVTDGKFVFTNLEKKSYKLRVKFHNKNYKELDVIPGQDVSITLTDDELK